MNSLIIKSVNANGRRLVVDFECRGQISKFFQTKPFYADFLQTKRFYADYSTPIQDVPEEILVIPFLATVLPIVWANHSVIYVNAVDETFLKSMVPYKKALQKMYPKLKLDGGIVAKHASSQNLVFHSRSMMLFSGGVDSLDTFIRHKNEHLILVCIHGADIKTGDDVVWKGAIAPIAEFARNNKSPIKTVRSNFREIVDSLILRTYDDYINEKNNWWGRVMFGLADLGLLAPLAYVEKVGKLYIASGITSEHSGEIGSHPSLDNTIKWTGTDVFHDGYELSRQQKLLLISEYVKSYSGQIVIRSCFLSETGGNCGRCEKCSRTILGLELAGLDPNKYGFNVKTDTFSNIKRELLNGGWEFEEDQMFMWGNIKRYAYLKDGIVHPDAKSLIDWLKNVDLISFRTKSCERACKLDFGRKLNPFFLCLPDPLYRIAKKCYSVVVSHFPFLR